MGEPGDSALQRDTLRVSRVTLLHFHCTFEWGASSVVQTAYATATRVGKPQYHCIWFTDDGGRQQVGPVRLVVHMMCGAVNDLFVVLHMHELPSIPRCQLKSSGCRQMEWCCEHSRL